MCNEMLLADVLDEYYKNGKAAILNDGELIGFVDDEEETGD